MPVSRFRVPDLGIGVGYRVPHYRRVIEDRPAVDWFELLSENFMTDGGSPRHWLDQVSAMYRTVPHGVSLSLGGVADPDHERRLLALLQKIQPPWFSDHLCWTGTATHRVHDLLPVPMVAAMRDHIAGRIRRIQDQAGCLFAVENVSAYLGYADSCIPEWDFLAEVAEAADCGILLDVNNIFVSSINLGFDPETYLKNIPLDRVVQVHLAGHTIYDGYRLDTHDRPVCEEVFALYRSLIGRLGPVSTLLERDGDIPPLEGLLEEADTVRRHREAGLAVFHAGGGAA